MKRVFVSVQGCDDSTDVIVELSELGRAGVEKLAAEVARMSTCDCQPTLHEIRDATPADERNVAERDPARADE